MDVTKQTPSATPRPASHQLQSRNSQGKGDCSSTVNVGKEERVISTVGGAIVSTFGLSRGGLTGIALVAVGAGLLYRGVSGHCGLYKALDVDASSSS